jgi:hypothetical protein
MAEKILTSPIVTRADMEITRVPATFTFADKLGAVMVRLALNRANYKVEPGLYAVGNPDADSIVLVSANYKLSFDTLRSQLGGLNAWIMVLDTKGINVWCAAGKGTFGTDEIVNRIAESRLETIVNHRRIILPQLGAVGVAAHEVKKRSGFSVIYGPVRARDIKAFIETGFEATEKMRQVLFSFPDRLILTGVEFVLGLKYFLIAAAAIIVLSGLNSSGYSFDTLFRLGPLQSFILAAAYLSGTVIAPALLPWLPGRSFSFKGFATGVIVIGILFMLNLTGGRLETAAWFFIFAAVSSFFTMNFTGASTYTSISGVQKEIRIAVPLQLASGLVGLCLWFISRFI